MAYDDDQGPGRKAAPADPLAEFDSLTTTAPKPAGGGDPLAEFDSLTGPATTPPAPSASKKGIDLRAGSGSAAGSNSGGGRGIVKRLRDAYMGAMDAVGQGMAANVPPPVTVDTASTVPLDPETAARRQATDEYEKGLALSQPAPAINVSVPALPGAPAPHRPDVGRHGLADAIAGVLATGQGGVDTGYSPPSAQTMTERSYLDSIKSLNDAWAKATDPARKSEIARTISQLNRQFMLGKALHPEGIEGFTSGLVSGATMGFAPGNPNQRAAKRALEADVESERAVTPGDLKEVGAQEAPTMIEGPSAGETAGQFVGTVLPFEAAERGALFGLRRAGGLLEGTRAAKIGDLLTSAGNLHAPVQYDTDIGEFFGKSARRAAGGQIGGAAVAAGNAVSSGHADQIPEAIGEGIAPFAALGAGLGAFGDLAVAPFAKDATAFRGYNEGFGARIRYASDLVEGTRPGDAITQEIPAIQDKTPLGDKTVEGQRSLLAKMLGEHLNNVEAARESYPGEVEKLLDERDVANPPAGPEWWEANAPAEPEPVEPSRIIQPEQYGGSRESKAAADERLRTAKEVALDKAGVDPTSLADQHDLSKRLAVQQEMQKALEEEAARAEMQKRLDEARASAPDRKQGPLTFGQAVARAARENPTDAADVSKREPIELGEGNNLAERLANSPNMNRHAAAIVPVAAASQTDDERKRTALLAAAAAIAGTTEDVRVPKAAMGAIMKAIRESAEELPASKWVSKLNEATGGKFDVSPIIDRLRVAADAADNPDVPLTLGDVRKAIGEAGNRPKSSKEIEDLPESRVIPWNERDNNGAMFFSRMRNAIEDEPDREMTAAEWAARLRKNTKFSQTEFRWTIEPSLRRIHEGDFDPTTAEVHRPAEVNGETYDALKQPLPDEKLSKQDILDMLDQKQIQLIHVRYGERTPGAREFEGGEHGEGDAVVLERERRAEAERRADEKRERILNTREVATGEAERARFAAVDKLETAWGMTNEEAEALLDRVRDGVEFNELPLPLRADIRESLMARAATDLPTPETLPPHLKIRDEYEEWEKQKTDGTFERERDWQANKPPYRYTLVDGEGFERGIGDTPQEAINDAATSNVFGKFGNLPNLLSWLDRYASYIGLMNEAAVELREITDARDAYVQHEIESLHRHDWQPPEMREQGPHFQWAQRFKPYGTGYREHLIVLGNSGMPKLTTFEKMHGSHWDQADVIGHYRAEMFNAAPYLPADEAKLQPLRDDVQAKADALLDFNDQILAAGVNEVTGAGATVEMQRTARELNDAHQAALAKLFEAASRLEQPEQTQKTYVAGETQSDLVQKATGTRKGDSVVPARGYMKPGEPKSAAEIAERAVKIADLKRQERDVESLLDEEAAKMGKLEEEQAEVHTAARESGHEWNQLTNKFFVKKMEEWERNRNGKSREDAEEEAYNYALEEGIAANRELYERKVADRNKWLDLDRQALILARRVALYRDQAWALGRAWRDLDDQINSGDVDNPSGLMATPYEQNSDIIPLLTRAMLYDAAMSGAERFAWASGQAKNALGSLKLKAGRTIYDQIIPSEVSKMLAFFGESPRRNPVGVGGFLLDSFEMTPELRKKIIKVGLPLLGAVAMVNATAEDAKAQGGSGKGIESSRGLWAAAGIIALLASSESARSAFKEFATSDAVRRVGRDDESGLFNEEKLHEAKSVVDADPNQSWIVMRPARDARQLPPSAMGVRLLGSLRDAGLPAQAFRTRDGYAIAVDSKRASGVLARVETALDKRKATIRSAIGDTFDSADAVAKDLAKSSRPGSLGITLYSNPVGPALQQIAKYPSAVALGTLGYAASQSDDERIRATGMPLMGLAALSLVGSERLGTLGDKATNSLVENLRNSKTGRAAVRFFNPEALLDPEVRTAIVRFEEAVKAGIARGGEVAKRSKALGPVGDRAVSDIVENEGWEDLSGIAPKDLQNILTVAAQYSDDFVKLGNEKVAAGVIPATSLLPDYAGPRVYAEHEGNAIMQNDEAAFRGSGMGGAKARIAAQKSRTLDLPLRDAEHKLREAQATGDPDAIDDAQSKLDEAKLIQLQQRLTLGEIRESSYRGALGMAKGYRDVGAAKLLDVVRQHPGAIHPEFEHALAEQDAAKQMLRAATSPADRQAAQDLLNQAHVDLAGISRRFNVKGGDYVTLPTTDALGPLSGMVVKREIAASINGMPDLKGWGTFLRFWKESKTVFNPGTHLGNILSNVAFAHMEGLSLFEQPKYLIRAALDMKRYGEGTKALAENGTLDFNAVTADNAGITARELRSEEGLRELAGTTRPETAKVLAEKGITPDVPSAARSIAPYVAGGAIGAGLGYYEAPDEAKGTGALTGLAAGLLAGSRPAREFSKRLYSNEDNIYRVAIYLKKIDDGMTPLQAADYAKSALGNFRSRSPALHILRGTIAPFVLYPAKAVPRLGAQIVDHPWRWVSMMAGIAALDQYSRSVMGPVNDKDLGVRDRSRMGYLFPGLVQLPFGGSAGERAAVDVSRYTPIGSVTTAAPPGSVAAQFDERAPALLAGSGPITDATMKFVGNKDPMTGDPVFKQDYTTGDNVRAGIEAASDILLPPAAAFHRKRIVTDVANNDPAALKNDILGPTGLRPRYVRPGAQAMNATFTLQNSLAGMQQELTRALKKSKSSARNAELVNQYKERVKNALNNYRDRVGVEPSDDVLKQANDFIDGLDSGHQE